MITSLSQFKKSLNENFGEEAQVQEPVQGAQEVQVQDDIQVQEEEGFSLEILTAAVNAELENMNAELEEGQEATPALTEEQLMAVFNAVSPMMSDDDDMEEIQDEDEIVEEGLRDMLGLTDKSAYKAQIAFLDGDSEEAKQITQLFKTIIDDQGKVKNDAAVAQKITRLGDIWARKNKMIGKDYNFSMLKTVMESDYGRKFRGGKNLSAGE